jgi:hypothetical protein
LAGAVLFPRAQFALRYVGLALVVALVAGCGSGRSSSSSAASDSTRLWFSPNGEALNGGPNGRLTCEQALTGWFDRADSGHDGGVTLDEFLADARRQFAVMDLDGDGRITPAELAAYRRPFLESLRRGVVARPPETPNNLVQNDVLKPLSTGPQRIEDASDPVMVADANLRNYVSLSDFLAYAQRNFADINTSHNGRLSRAEALVPCNRD